MANTVVSGKGAPTHIGGSLSDGIFFQNLGTNPIFVGYGDQTGAAVSSSACDGVIQPGGSYSVGAKRDVWLYADVDSPVVYNYDATASADGGTNVSATVAGSVAVTNPVTSVGINGKPTVAVPDGVAINGPVAINGNVGIVGSVGIAGNVNVQGSINAFGQQAHTLLGSQYNPSVAPGNYVRACTQANVTAMQSLLISENGDNNSSANGDICVIVLTWYDDYGNYVTAENFHSWLTGRCYVITPVKAALVTIDVYNLANISGASGAYRGMAISAWGSTIALPEYYDTRVGGTGAYQGVVGATSNTGGALQAAAFEPGFGASLLQASINTNSSIKFNLSTIARHAVFTYQQYGGPNQGLVLYGRSQWGDIPIFNINNNTNVNDIQIPKMPLAILASAANTAGQSFAFSMAYEHF